MGRVATRAAIAHQEKPPNALLALFQAACRSSLRPGGGSDAIPRALLDLPPGTDPLWPALARHIARLSTPADRALLEDLARHPEEREPPLSWGLRYYVRGDLVFDDDTELTLDDLCDQIGRPHLPYLEDMPDELEVD